MTPPVTLSHCALKYATAIADPWSIEAEGACIPRHPTRNSMKVRGFGRFKITVGTGGVGFAYLIPNVSNDTASIVYSTSTYAGTNANVSVNSNTTGVSTGSLSGLPFGYTSFQPSDKYTPAAAAGRIVSCAMSWQYTGTVSDMGGVCYAFVSPDHSNTNNIGTDKIGAYAETQVTRVDNKRHWIGLSSLDDVELNYPEPADNQTVSPIMEVVCPYSNGDTFSSYAGDSNLGGSPACIWIQGKAGITFQVEVVTHIEYVGSVAQYALTPTHSDAVGFEIVSNAAARLPSLAQAKPEASRPSLMKEALTQIGHELRPAAAVVGKSLLSIAGNAIAGAAFGVAKYGMAGMITGGALGAASGALRLTNG